jgi:hypothetical protein
MAQAASITTAIRQLTSRGRPPKSRNRAAQFQWLRQKRNLVGNCHGEILKHEARYRTRAKKQPRGEAVP